MDPAEIARERLHAQRLSPPDCESPGEVVAWLSAVQAQDYTAALWAVGLRMRGATEQAVEQAIAERKIVRTWLMRGTLHFVAPADIRWMLKLTAPRSRASLANTIRYQQLALDEATFVRSQAVLAEALAGGKQLTRQELAAAFEQGGIATEGLQLAFLLQRAQADAVICQGARRGRQQTFVLLDEWVPPGRTFEGDEAAAELARRYFLSHGPATVQDYAWWTGLTVAEARAGVEAAGGELHAMQVGKKTYWWSRSTAAALQNMDGAHLLPAYDEYLVSYRDRTAALDPAHLERWSSGYVVLGPVIVVGDRAVGTWKRTLGKGSVTVETDLFSSLSSFEMSAVVAAARRYADFLGLPVTLA